MQKPLFLGFNWKLNPNNLEAVQNLLEVYTELQPSDNLDICVFPPSIYLHQVSEISVINPSLSFGSQTISSYESGAFTGELSVLQVKDLGAKYVLIGHSETRKLHNLSDSDINLKVKLTLDNGLNPVLCIGYSNQNNSAEINHGELKQQLVQGLENTKELLKSNQNSKIIIAYEPVWAIGTGKTTSKDQITEVLEYLTTELVDIFEKELLDQISLIYGGSVDDSNCLELLQISNLQGFLIGGASLKADKVAKIVNSINTK